MKLDQTTDFGPMSAAGVARIAVEDGLTVVFGISEREASVLMDYLAEWQMVGDASLLCAPKWF